MPGDPRSDGRDLLRRAFDILFGSVVLTCRTSAITPWQSYISTTAVGLEPRQFLVQRQEELARAVADRKPTWQPAPCSGRRRGIGRQASAKVMEQLPVPDARRERVEPDWDDARVAPVEDQTKTEPRRWFTRHGRQSAGRSRHLARFFSIAAANPHGDRSAVRTSTLKRCRRGTGNPTPDDG